MAGATEKPGSSSRPWRLTPEEPRVLSEDAEIKKSALPPIEVKVNPGKSTEKLNIGEYETGTGRGL